MGWLIIPLTTLEISMILVTMIVTISDLVLNIIRLILGKKSEEAKSQLEKSKYELQQAKTGIDLLFQFIPSLKGVIDIDLDKPELVQEQIEKIKKFSEKLKEITQK